MAKEYSKELLLSLYRTMFLIRRFEEQGVKLYRQGLMRGYFHPYWGEEAIAAGVCAALGKQDYIVSTHRGHGHCIAWGADPAKMFAELLGRKSGYCKGLGGSMHIADYARGNLGANGVVGSGAPIGVGAALGAKIRGENRVSVVFLSDGAANIGTFSEAMNLAATWHLPVIFVMENNQYAVSTPVESSTGEPELWKRGTGYGVKSERIDGNDVILVYEKTLEMVNDCRKGEGPCLLECLTFRKSGHHVNDPGDYMPKEKLEYFNQHDPLLIGRKILKKFTDPTDTELNEIEQNVMNELEDAIRFAMDSEEMTESEFNDFIKGYE
jgi:TPP-dependent pyruvate/acetoin dehydrogenase alpha subunit